MVRVLNIKYKKEFSLMSHKAETAPPLSTILGNIGVNTMKFCEEYNLFTKDLPSYFLVIVNIHVFENRTFKFILKGPSIGSILNLLKFEKKVKIQVHDRMHEKIINCISLKNILQLALFKFPNINLINSVPIILGTVKSMKLIIV